MKLFNKKKPLTKFQIKQKMLDQLNLSLNWSKQAINESYHGTLSHSDLEELRKIRFMLKRLMKDIETGEFEVKK